MIPKNKMRYFYILIIVLIPNFTFFGIFQDKKLALAACLKPVAKVISFNHPNYKFGTSICSNTSLKISTVKKLEVVCTFEPKTVVVKQAADLATCPKSKYDDRIQFSDAPDVDRGPIDEPKLLQPYGVVVQGPQVMLQWQPVTNALEYEITVDDGFGDWRSYKSSHASQLIDSLKAGRSYQILIFVDDMRKSTNFLKVLSQKDKDDLLKSQALLFSLKDSITKEDFLILQLGLLNKFNLLNKSIEIASTEFFRNPSNQSTARILGDLYVSASRPNEALSAYKRYLTIAEKQNNKHDISDAKQRIQYVEKYARL